MTNRDALARRFRRCLLALGFGVAGAWGTGGVDAVAHAADDAGFESENDAPDENVPALAAADASLSWSISPGRVALSPGGPYAMPLDGEMYWLFTMAFQPVTSQALLQEAYRDIVENAGRRNEEDDAEADRIQQSDIPNAQKNPLLDAIRRRKENRATELPAIRAQLETLRQQENARRLPRVKATLHTDGQVFPELGDHAVRNYFERRVDRRYYTSDELGRTDLRELKTRRGHIQNREVDVVDVVFIFKRVLPVGPRVELRIAGLGNATFPRFEPGAVLYARNLVVDDPSVPAGRRFYDPAMRQALRAYYTVDGGDARPNFTLDRLDADWLWMWATRLRAGHPREIDVTRGRGDAALTRRMRYVPVLFVNDTARPQRFGVSKAGLFADVTWAGLPVRTRFTDGFEVDQYWTTLAQREIGRRVVAGEERQAVEELENAALPGVDPEEDLAIKADVLPPEGRTRLPDRATLPPRTRTRGLIVTHAEFDNIDEVLDRMATALWLRHTVGTTPSANAESEGEDASGQALFAAYSALYPARPEGLTDEQWALVRPPEPDADAVERVILTHAYAQAQADSAVPTVDEFRRYNHHRFANIALDDVADERAFARALLEDEGPAATGVRARLSAPIRETLARLRDAEDPAQGPDRNARLAMLDAVNRTLARPDLYTTESLDAGQNAELKELLARGRVNDRPYPANLTEAESHKLNRLFFDEGLGTVLRPCLDRAVLGHLLNRLSDAAIRSRIEDGRTDVFLHVVTRDGPDEAELSLPFQQYIMPLFPPYSIPEKVAEVLEAYSPAEKR